VPFLVKGIGSFATLLFSAFIGLGAVVLGTPLAVVLGLVNFFASYIPYIGAVGGGVGAVLLAIAGGGIAGGLWMLLIVILANSVFQTVVQQLPLGATLKQHAERVQLVTTIGGVLGGALASAMAAPFVAISLDAVRQIRAAGLSLIRPLPNPAGRRPHGRAGPRPSIPALPTFRRRR